MFEVDFKADSSAVLEGFLFGATLKQNLLEVDFKVYAIAVLVFCS